MKEHQQESIDVLIRALLLLLLFFVFGAGCCVPSDSESRVNDGESYEHLSSIIADHDQWRLIRQWSTELIDG